MKSEVAIVQCTCKKFVFCGGGYDKSLQIGQEPFLEAATTKSHSTERLSLQLNALKRLKSERTKCIVLEVCIAPIRRNKALGRIDRLYWVSAMFLLFSSVSSEMRNYEKVDFPQREVVNSMDSGTNLLAIESWLCHILAVWPCGSNVNLNLS